MEMMEWWEMEMDCPYHFGKWFFQQAKLWKKIKLIHEFQTNYFRYPSSFNLHDKRVFFVLLIHQAFCSFTFGGLNISFTILLISYLEFHNYQVKLLSCRLEAFGQVELPLKQENQEADYANLVELIKMHVEIKRLVKKFLNNIPNICTWNNTDSFIGALINSTYSMADPFTFKFYNLWAYWHYL